MLEVSSHNACFKRIDACLAEIKDTVGSLVSRRVDV